MDVGGHNFGGESLLDKDFFSTVYFEKVLRS